MLQNFDKSSERFPVKKERIFLNSCGVSPLFTGALRAEYEYAEKHSRLGNVLFRSESGLDKFHSSAGKLLRTSAENISLMKNCAEPLNLIAQGYPFDSGDEIISYAHEYPSNHYPWRLQEKRGVKLKLLSDCDPQGSLPPGKPRGFSFGELERLITPRTKIVALSHVQFTSGFAADLESIGKLCRSKGIDLVVDAAQSLGSLPLYPESFGIAAVVASGWKWLLGPIGTGILYTSPEFREKIEITHGGPDMMAQGVNYLDYTWNPVKSGARFEYSTVTYSVAAGLLASIDQIFLKYTVEEINREIFRLQDLFIKELDTTNVTPVLWAPPHRSGIVSLITKRDPEHLMQELDKEGIIMTVRGGYLRFAPHSYCSDTEVQNAVKVLNRIAGQL